MPFATTGTNARSVTRSRSHGRWRTSASPNSTIEARDGPMDPGRPSNAEPSDRTTSAAAPTADSSVWNAELTCWPTSVATSFSTSQTGPTASLILSHPARNMPSGGIRTSNDRVQSPTYAPQAAASATIPPTIQPIGPPSAAHDTLAAASISQSRAVRTGIVFPSACIATPAVVPIVPSPESEKPITLIAVPRANRAGAARIPIPTMAAPAVFATGDMVFSCSITPASALVPRPAHSTNPTNCSRNAPKSRIAAFCASAIACRHLKSMVCPTTTIALSSAPVSVRN